MKMKDYLKTWEGALSENRFHRLSVAGMLVIMVILLFMALGKSERIVMQPVTLKNEAWVEKSTASREYKESWGLYLALLMGNVTPDKGGFIIERIKPLLSTQIYNDTINALKRQIEDIKENRATFRFEASDVKYERATGKVFVVGMSFERGSAGDESRSKKTFEYKIEVEQYTPKVTWVDTYKGRARTQEHLRRLKQSGNLEG